MTTHPCHADDGGSARPAGPVSGTARLHVDSGAARRARGVVDEWLTAWWGPADTGPPGRAALRDRLAVVCSELVSNAAVHGEHPPLGAGRAPRLALELHLGDRTVRLVVADRGPVADRPAFRPTSAPSLPPAWAESGRGLYIVDQLADAWQAEPAPDGLTVWCDFHLEPAPAA